MTTPNGPKLVAALALTLGLVIAGASCIERDLNQTISIEPDGSVTWTVIEANVRSDNPDGPEFQREADEWFSRARAGRHGTAEAFRALGATSVESQILREVWPYAVSTTGRFPDPGSLFQVMLDRLGIDGRSTIEQIGGRTTWTISYSPDEPGPAARRPDDDEANQGLEALVSEWPKQCRFAIRHGRFVDSVGFDIEAGGHGARLRDDADEARKEADGPVAISLAWSVGR
jgi:hypothetical protein